jgi:hypothetical protein
MAVFGLKASDPGHKAIRRNTRMTEIAFFQDGIPGQLYP